MKRYEAIAAAFKTVADLEDLLEEAGISDEDMPSMTPEVTWRQHCRAVVQRIEQGVVTDGVTKLVKAAKKLRPGHPEIVKLTAPVDPALLAVWLHHVERANANLTAAFDRPGMPQLLDHIYVELQVTDRAFRHLGKRGLRDTEAIGQLAGRLTLDDILCLDPTKFRSGLITRRWLLYGDPGSGKTTLLRHLAWKLAKCGNAAPWVPIFASLPRLLREKRAWLEVLVDDLASTGVELEALRSFLEQQGRGGRLLVLFDGLDEVPSDQHTAAKALLARVAGEYAEAPIVVTSRPIGGYRPGTDFRDLELLPFEEDDRRAFLERWLGDADRADALLGKARREASVWDLAGNPLYLTLLALLFEEEIEIPERRSALYDRIFSYLLGGKHRRIPKSITRQGLVRMVLRSLADSMTEDNRDAEALDMLEERLANTEDVVARLEKVACWRDNPPHEFLQDVATKTSILGPHDGLDADWRYWHRTFREALAAEELYEQLKREGEPAVLERARRIEGDLGRWAEPYALLVGQVDVPDALVKTLMKVNRPLGLRALATAQGLAEKTIDELLGLTSDLHERRKVFQGILRLLGDADAALQLIDRLRKRTSEGNDLFFLDAAVAEVGNRWSKVASQAEELRGRLFDHLAAPSEKLFRWIETPLDGRVALWREMPSGRYRLGKYADQEVTLTAGLRMASVPVTNAQYQAFDPSFCPLKWDGVEAAELKNHPAVNITWFAAMSFCRWLACMFSGARLPTEAEWEVACRAGTMTKYWSGDSEKDLNRVGWYKKNSDGRTHRVGEKEANPWGLYDVHGNVWEWTLTGQKLGDPLDPKVHTPESSTDLAKVALSAIAHDRVFRGGSFWLSAVGARSANRGIWAPRNRDWSQGFRVVLMDAPFDY